MDNIRLTKQDDGYAVKLDGIEIGRVRQTGGEWTARLWTLQPPSRTARMLEPVEGNFRRRFTAVLGLVDAWGDDNA